MKKYILIFLLAFGISFSQWSTSSWDDELPFDKNMIIKGDTIILAGSLNNLLVSIDNGETYSDRSFHDNTFSMNNIFFSGTTLVFISKFGTAYYSDDLGLSWVLAAIDESEFDNNSKTIIHKNIIFILSRRNLYISDNNGKSYELFYELDNDLFMDLVIVNDSLIFHTYKNFYKLDESGTNLEVFNLNLPNDEILKYIENNNTFKVFDDIIILGMNEYQTKVFYYSTDEGNTWTKCDTSPFIYDSFNLTKYKDQFYISNDENLFVSNDTCKSWEIISTPFPLHKTNYFVKNNDKLYSVVGNEIYAFDGNEWSKWYGKNNYGNPQQLKYIDNYLYAASYSSEGFSSFDERLFGSSDNGKTWEPAIIGLDSIREYKFIGDMIVAAYSDYNYLISTENGATWKELGIDDASFRDIRAYEKNIIVTNYLYENLLSTDNGESWTNINEQLPFQISKKPTIEIYDTKLLMEHNGSLYYSDDLGSSWNDISDGMPEIPRYPDMYIDDFLIIISFDNKIYISYDKGVTWNERSSNFPEKFHITRIKKFENKLFIVSQEDYARTNIYFSQDIGLSWKKITEEYDDNLYITDFVIKDDQIIIGNSLFRQMYGELGKIVYADLNIVSVDNSDESNDFITIHPNPASDYIEISFGSHRDSKGASPLVSSDEIAIYNVLGEKVLHSSTPSLRILSGAEVRNDGHFDYAQCPVKIDISHLPRGVYFVRVGAVVEKFVKY